MKKMITVTAMSLMLLNINASANYSLLKTVVIKVVKTIKPHPNYRKTALKSSPKTKGGWVTDPYSGRKCRKRDAHADHIWPQSKGGPNYSWNLVMSCAQDNIRKSNNIGVETIQGYTEKIKQVILK